MTEAGVIYLNAKAAKRPTIPLNVIRSVQEKCHVLNDGVRWSIALISDMSMGLIEAIGLHNLWKLENPPQYT